MAVKDHSLDMKIIDAAKEEFKEHGFQKASLHKIAEKAGITTGALYTRYKNKDDLYCSLVQEIFDAVKEHSNKLYALYMDAQNSGEAEKLLYAIKAEKDIYEELLFNHYDACFLFYCRNAGSSVEKMLKEMMTKKANETVEYFKGISKTDMELDGIGILISEQFHFFREILERGYSREKAIECMKAVDIYQEAGWKALFEAIL